MHIYPVLNSITMSADKRITSIDDTDDALLLEILALGFPTSRMAHQCKLVCKRWKTLISDPIFMQRWKELRPNQRQPVNIVINHRICSEDREYTTNYLVLKPPSVPSFDLCSFKLDFLPCFEYSGEALSVRIAATCNGLLLCHSAKDDFVEQESMAYYICNPVTRDWVAVPPLPTRYDPMIVDVAVGLVWDERNLSCRVVRIHDTIGLVNITSSFLAEVFSPETNNWEEKEVSHPHNSPFCFDFTLKTGQLDSIFSWNSVLFWENRMYMSIVAYNPLEPDKCHIINTPGDPSGNRIHHLVFGECKGSFRLLQHCHFDRNHIAGGRGFFRIWELEDYHKGEWSFKNEIFFREMVSDDDALNASIYRPWGPALQVFSLDPNDEATVYFHDNHSWERARRIFRCNLETKKVKLIDGTRTQRISDDDHYSFCTLFQCVVTKWPAPAPAILPQDPPPA